MSRINKSRILYRITHIVLLMTVVFVMTGCNVERPKPEFDPSKINMGLESGLALNQAYDVYQQAKEGGMDFTAGPCLSNELFGNPEYPETMWVLDIAHNPRQAVDDQPANQCSAYREGKAQNFIELDSDGKLIRLYSPLLSNN